jgi:hypothetical protein
MERDDNRFYDENCNFLFVKAEDDGAHLSDYIFIHKDISSDKGFMAHFESYKDDVPIEVYSLKKISLTDIKNIEKPLFQANYSEETSWKRLRIKAILPTTWKMLFEQIINKL